MAAIKAELLPRCGEPTSYPSVDAILRRLFTQSPTTESHSIRMTVFFPLLVQLMLPPSSRLPAEELWRIRTAALLHDIGKLPFTDVVESRGPVDHLQLASIHQHPLVGKRLLFPFFPYNHPAMQVALCHHERWDGKGYPYGVKGEDIPWLARVFTVVDQFDAATHKRTYNHSTLPAQALDEICHDSGRKFDPQVVRVFADNFEFLALTGTY